MFRKKIIKNPKIGLALGAGAAHGMAHIGVLQALEEQAISIDLIAGTSAGAVVGFLYACGFTIGEMKDLAQNLRWQHLLSFRPNNQGLFRTDKLGALLKNISGNPDWDDLKIPFYAVSFDYTSGKVVSPRDISPADAVHASISVPLFFHPFRYAGTALGDGGLTENVPSRFLKEQGADKIIAVNVLGGGLKKYSEIRNFNQFFSQIKKIMIGHTYRPFKIFEDIYIMPDLSKYSIIKMSKFQWFYEQGYKKTVMLMPQILELLETRK